MLLSYIVLHLILTLTCLEHCSNLTLDVPAMHAWISYRALQLLLTSNNNSSNFQLRSLSFWVLAKNDAVKLI